MEKAKADVEDDISQGSESKSDSNGQSSTPGLDSDHDYTIIGSSSPTHTEDRWVKLSFLASTSAADLWIILLFFSHTFP